MTKKNKATKTKKSEKNMKIEYFLDLAHDMSDGKALKADGFDDAIIGVIDSNRTALAYSKAKMIEILIKNDKMSYEDAIEYLEFNTWCAWVGEGTPIYVDDMY